MKSNLSIFSLVAYAFVVIPKKTLPRPNIQRFIAMFSSKSFMVLAPTFRSMGYFELFVNGVR